MTDQDRGAYTPQTDAPLAFDARHWRESDGRPLPMTLIMSGVVLVVLVAGLAVFYRGGVRGPGQPPQVVGSPVQDAKAPPSSEAAASDAAAGLQVYKAEVTPPGEGRAPTTATLAPPPEAPAPRPLAPVEQADLRPAQAEPAPKPAPAAPAAAPAVAAPVAALPAAPLTAKPVKPARLAAALDKFTTTLEAKSPAERSVASAPAQTKSEAAAAPAGAAVVQIGAFSSEALADKGWSDVAVLMPGKMAGKSRRVEMGSRDGKTFYRTFVGGFATKASAQSFCESLKATGHGCMVK